MRKSIFIFMLFCMGVISSFANSTDISTYEDVIYITDAKVAQGCQVTLSVKMKNSFDAPGFQFDLVLPDGFTVAKDADDMYMIALSTERTTAKKTNYFDGALQADGSFRILCNTSAKDASTGKLYVFSGNDGEVCTITLNVASTVAYGNYDIVLKNIEISDLNSVGHAVADVIKSVMTVSDNTASYDVGYSVQIAPFEFNEDVDGLEFVLNSQKDLINVSFDVELPENIGNNQLYTITKALGNTTAATSIDDDEAGSVSVSIARKSTKTIKDGNTVAKLELGYDGDVLSAGIYALNIKNVKMTDTDGNEYDAAPVTSYIKIGEPTNASLSLSGLVTSDVNDALAEETAITSLDMSNVTAIDGTLSLVDRRSYVAPKRAVDVEKVEYIRSMSNSFGTVCVPFDIASDETIQLYQLKNVADNAMTFEPVANISAGTPAVFKLLSGSQADFVAENATISAGEESCDCTIDGESWTMNGTYVNMNLDPAACSNDIYYISENKFVYGNMAFDVATYRAWFETPKSAAGTKVFNIEIDDDAETTGVKYVEKADGMVDVVFDLSGNKLPSAKNGINIINGKKVFVK